MSAPDMKRIIASCIYAAASIKAAAQTPSDSDDGAPVTPVKETPLWIDLPAADQKVFMDVSAHLYSFTKTQPLKDLDEAAAAGSVFSLFGVGWAATAVHVFKHVATEFLRK